jgi:hypothetical protein
MTTFNASNFKNIYFFINSNTIKTKQATPREYWRSEQKEGPVI